MIELSFRLLLFQMESRKARWGYIFATLMVIDSHRKESDEWMDGYSYMMAR